LDAAAEAAGGLNMNEIVVYHDLLEAVLLET
jgi:hypothetical protein